MFTFYFFESADIHVSFNMRVCSYNRTTIFIDRLISIRFAVRWKIIVNREIDARGWMKNILFKMRVTVTARFYSGGYIAVQVSPPYRVYLDGVWHKSFNSYRGTATWSGMRQVKISLTRLHVHTYDSLRLSGQSLPISMKDNARHTGRPVVISVESTMQIRVVQAHITSQDEMSLLTLRKVITNYCSISFFDAGSTFTWEARNEFFNRNSV